jgi:Zn finger protein HypA/HybF involved in hydrogenase expression
VQSCNIKKYKKLKTFFDFLICTHNHQQEPNNRISTVTIYLYLSTFTTPLLVYYPFSTMATHRSSTEGNRKVIKVENTKTECHICKKNGEHESVVGSHSFRNHRGRVVCQRFLRKLAENQCYKCKEFGHFASKCSRVKTVHSVIVPRPKIAWRDMTLVKDNKQSIVHRSSNVFGELDSSSDEEIEKEMPIGKPMIEDGLSRFELLMMCPDSECEYLAPNVTVRCKKQKKSWADEDSSSSEE